MRLLAVESGHAGFLTIPCAPRQLSDLNAVFSEKAKTIPPLTRRQHVELEPPIAVLSTDPVPGILTAALRYVMLGAEWRGLECGLRMTISGGRVVDRSSRRWNMRQPNNGAGEGSV
jgi:hypothetical protein